MKQHLKISHGIALANWNVYTSLNNEADPEIKINTFEILAVHGQPQFAQILIPGQQQCEDAFSESLSTLFVVQIKFVQKITPFSLADR